MIGVTRFQVADELHLALGLSTTGRHDNAAEFLRAAMQAKSAGEEAVAIRIVQHIAWSSVLAQARIERAIRSSQRSRSACV